MQDSRLGLKVWCFGSRVFKDCVVDLLLLGPAFARHIGKKSAVES